MKIPGIRSGVAYESENKRLDSGFFNRTDMVRD